MIVNGKRIKGLQAYKVKGKQEYLYVWMNEGRYNYVNDSHRYLAYECFATFQDGDILPNCHTSCSEDYLKEECRAMSFAKLPNDVKKHLINYVGD